MTSTRNELQATLMEDFQEAELSHSVWSSLIGGQVETPPTVLGQGRAVLFQGRGRGRGLRLLESVGLDLRSAEAVQFMLDFVGDGHVNSLQRRLASVIYLQCSVDKGALHIPSVLNGSVTLPNPILCMNEAN